MEILKVENLVKTYGKGENQINAVDNVSFTIDKGEFVAIVGASGSGKSTLLHLLGGVDRPTSGKVYIDGKDIYSLNNETIIQMLSLGLIELANEELVITEIGDLYLNKVMEEKSLLLLRYLSANNKAFDAIMANSLRNNESVKRVSL